ncbi:Domain of unknown function DUF2059 [Rhabdaerophilaceae bacterium]
MTATKRKSTRLLPLEAMLLAVLLVFSSAQGIFAQQNAAAPVLPSHLAIATDVLKASGLSRTFETSVPNVVSMLRTNVTRQRPELARDIEEALKVVEGKVPEMTSTGVSEAARFLAARMTEAELTEVNTFLSSAVGKKYVDTLPLFMDDMLPYLERWTQNAGQTMTGLFREEMLKRGHRL